MSTQGFRQYNLEESDEILRIAGGNHVAHEDFSHADLVKAAAELGIPEAAIQQAERLIREQQSEAADRAEFRRYKIKQIFNQVVTTGTFVLLFSFFRGMSASNGAVPVFFMTLLTSILGLIFYKSTKTEIEFLAWRSGRKARIRMREVGTMQVILEFRWASGKFASQSELVDYLVRKRIADEPTAWKVVEEFVRNNPKLEVPRGQDSASNVI